MLTSLEERMYTILGDSGWYLHLLLVVVYSIIIIIGGDGGCASRADYWLT